jgi:hypothetical protein
VFWLITEGPSILFCFISFFSSARSGKFSWGNRFWLGFREHLSLSSLSLYLSIYLSIYLVFAWFRPIMSIGFPVLFGLIFSPRWSRSCQINLISCLQSTKKHDKRPSFNFSKKRPSFILQEKWRDSGYLFKESSWLDCYSFGKSSNPIMLWVQLNCLPHRFWVRFLELDQILIMHMYTSLLFLGYLQLSHNGQQEPSFVNLFYWPLLYARSLCHPMYIYIPIRFMVSSLRLVQNEKYVHVHKG